jgi:hypothetical protein
MSTIPLFVIIEMAEIPDPLPFEVYKELQIIPWERESVGLSDVSMELVDSDFITSTKNEYGVNVDKYGMSTLMFIG